MLTRCLSIARMRSIVLLLQLIFCAVAACLLLAAVPAWASPGSFDAEIGRPDAEDLSYDWDSPEHAKNILDWSQSIELAGGENRGTSRANLNYADGSASDIVAVALDQPDGLPEGGDSNKYNNFNNEPWCAYFVAWCARQAGVEEDVIPSIFECGRLLRFYEDQGRWNAPEGYVPKPGDLIFYSEWSGGPACHVGIVTGVDAGYVYTKEGNTTGDVVSSRKRTVGASYVAGNWYIKGYASPDYAGHVHRFDQMTDASYEAIGDSDMGHIVTYIPTCRCGLKSEEMSSKEAPCAWQHAESVYSCIYCLRQYDIDESSNHYRLFVDVLAEVEAAGGPSKVWYVSPWLEYAVENGLMAGVNCSDGLWFYPSQPITRAQVASVLYKASQEVLTDADSNFTDVAANDWYAEAVTWAASAGVVSGYEDGSFRPNNSITRQELAVMVMKYQLRSHFEPMPDPPIEYHANDINPDETFADWDEVASWAKDAMAWCAAEGIISGMPSGDETIAAPGSTATRAQAATIITKVAQA